MKAAWYEKQGNAREVLVVGEMDDPQPQAGVQARAEGLGGAFTIRSQPGAGTAVILDLPR